MQSALGESDRQISFVRVKFSQINKSPIVTFLTANKSRWRYSPLKMKKSASGRISKTPLKGTRISLRGRGLHSFQPLTGKVTNKSHQFF